MVAGHSLISKYLDLNKFYSNEVNKIGFSTM